MNDQYGLVSADGRLLDFTEALNIVAASDMFTEKLGAFPEGAYVINLTILLDDY